ncbi:MAG: GIY-YIG nuclease family protein [Bacteroidota bacterium]
MKQYFVYILLCSDNSYYTGITNDVEIRVEQHQIGLNKTCYTYKRRPVTLVFHTPFNNVHQAIAFEKQVKGWRRAKKEALINGDLYLLSELAKTAKNK